MRGRSLINEIITVILFQYSIIRISTETKKSKVANLCQLYILYTFQIFKLVIPRNFFWLHHMAYRILVPQTGIELLPSAVKEQRLNHWTREFPPLSREWFSIISYQSFILLEFFSRYCPIVPAPIIKYVIYLTAFIFLIFFSFS